MDEKKKVNPELNEKELDQVSGGVNQNAEAPAGRKNAISSGAKDEGAMLVIENGPFVDPAVPFPEEPVPYKGKKKTTF